jgi:hypothetical protein
MTPASSSHTHAGRLGCPLFTLWCDAGISFESSSVVFSPPFFFRLIVWEEFTRWLWPWSRPQPAGCSAEMAVSMSCAQERGGCHYMHGGRGRSLNLLGKLSKKEKWLDTGTRRQAACVAAWERETESMLEGSWTPQVHTSTLSVSGQQEISLHPGGAHVSAGQVQQRSSQARGCASIARAGLVPKFFAKWYCSFFRCYLANII